MFLGMQDFDFARLNLINFVQISPKFCPQKNLEDAAASSAPTALGGSLTQNCKRTLRCS